MGGDWINNRLYLKDYHLRDLGWQLQDTTSASRWVDPHFQGVKFRVNMVHSPLQFVAKLTDFWGLRFGLKARGLFPVNDWGYVVEVGSGTF